MITSQEARSNYANPELENELCAVNEAIAEASIHSHSVTVSVSWRHGTKIRASLVDRGFITCCHFPMRSDDQEWSIKIEW